MKNTSARFFLEVHLVLASAGAQGSWAPVASPREIEVPESVIALAVTTSWLRLRVRYTHDEHLQPRNALKDEKQIVKIHEK